MSKVNVIIIQYLISRISVRLCVYVFVVFSTTVYCYTRHTCNTYLWYFTLPDILPLRLPVASATFPWQISEEHACFYRTEPCVGQNRRKIRLIEGNPKCRHLKKFTCKGTCGRCVSVWGPEPHTPPPYTLYTVYLFTQGGKGEGGGRVGPERTVATIHKSGSKIHMTDCISSITLINTCGKAPLQVNIFRWRNFALMSI